MFYQNADTELWQLYREGDRVAYTTIVKRYYRALNHYGQRFVADQQLIQDCIQELFIQLWINREQVGSAASIKNYLLKALRHHIFRQLHAEKYLSEHRYACSFDLLEELDAETLMIQNESAMVQIAELQRQLAALPTREREALYLKYYQNLSITEIATIMEVNRQSVSNFLHKGLTKVRDRWLTSATFILVSIVKIFS